MRFLTAQRWPWMALLLSGGLLGGAWFFQYVLGYAPCQMCYWQRHAHKGVLAVAVIALMLAAFGKARPRLFAVLIGLAFLVSFGYAFWHVGVEYKWWEGPKTCLSGTPKLGEFNGTSLLDSLDKKHKMPGCSEASWWFLGLTMAGWNAVLSLLGAAFSFFVAKKGDHV